MANNTQTTTADLIQATQIKQAAVTLSGLLEQKALNESNEQQRKSLEQAKQVAQIGLNVKA